MASFQELTGFQEETEGGIAALRHAVAVLTSSEQFGDEMESANHHSMDRDLKEFASDLHIHMWNYDEMNDYGDYREIPCSVDNCYRVKCEETYDL